MRLYKQRASRLEQLAEQIDRAAPDYGVAESSLAALAASDRFELVALADLRTKARAECAARYPGIATYATHQELFARHPADVVCVATYPPTHLPIALDALGLSLAGLLVEKALGDTYAAGSAIVAQVKRRGRDGRTLP